jgi:hypothetical protein
MIVLHQDVRASRKVWLRVKKDVAANPNECSAAGSYDQSNLNERSEIEKHDQANRIEVFEIKLYVPGNPNV